ncbi:MAG: DUF1735 and LamG domain-containing protein [Bacteroides sp.]|nr:DUF1735 and LamG domain-containing protein [Bacteroides sp.]MCM1413297.1 DUF1735 and LamG domain-containing protein [Bacteroides sp.]MCM1471393.1 DUF1735 and LamG domain-containing protein [Bacteroides sp.]
MKKILYAAAMMMVSMGALTSCQDDYENVADDNKLWDPTVDRVSLTLLDGKADEVTKNLNVTMAMPEAYDVNVVYAVAPEKLEEYKAIYGGSPVLLPTDNYTVVEDEATIPAGGVTSTNASITFTGLLALDPETVYVLPVSIISSTVPSIPSRVTTYFVFRGAALINTVANMTGTCLRFVNEGQCPQLAGLSQMTVEFLIRPDAFSNQLSTIIGIEGASLVRIGDAGIPSNQLQFAKGSNATDAAWQFDIGKWTFCTMTYDGSTGDVNVYFNGVKKGSTQRAGTGSVNWNVVSSDRACYIGYAYDTNRDFQGDISELRVWNRILTTEEMNARNHFYRVDTDAEGLVAYWKFDEGAGNTVHDYANGYDMYVPATYPGKSSKPGDLKWNAVTLP